MEKKSVIRVDKIAHMMAAVGAAKAGETIGEYVGKLIRKNNKKEYDKILKEGK